MFYGQSSGQLSRRALFGRVAGFAFVGLLSLTWTGQSWADGKSSLGVPGVKGGVVATSEPAAAEAGAEILRQGGNAIDAAAAIAFALNVVEPQSSGIGGGGFMMIHLAKSGETFVVDSRERTPALGDAEMFLDSNGDPFSFTIRSTSGIGAGVPGMVRGLDLAVSNWGKLSFAEVLQPAIRLARDGFRVSTRLEGSIDDGLNSGRTPLNNELGVEPYDAARAVFAPGGVGLSAGDLLVQPDLAGTLQTLADEGPDAFYTGPMAEAIVVTQNNARSVADPADMARLRGRMQLSDLATYEAAVREPVVGDYRGFKIVSMPPPSSGGLTVIYMLKALERFPLGDASQGFGFGSTTTLHVMIEAMRLAFADRAVWMGDTDFVDLPVRGIISDGYIAGRSALIDPNSRQDNVVADDPRPFDMAALPGKVQLAAVRENPQEGRNTTHFSVVDRDGNIVTYTNTIESGFGTGMMVPGFGFMLNNELTDFNRVPAANSDPANFNPGANDAAAFKRPRSSMAPTMIFDGKRPLAAFGSPGGSTIINSVFNVTLNLIDHERPIQEAIDLPRLSQTSANGTPSREAGFADAAIDGLRALGHSPRNPSVIGSVQAVVVERGSKLQFGGADDRRIGRVISIRRDEIAGGGDDDDDD